MRSEPCFDIIEIGLGNVIEKYVLIRSSDLTFPSMANTDCVLLFTKHPTLFSCMVNAGSPVYHRRSRDDCR